METSTCSLHMFAQLEKTKKIADKMAMGVINAIGQFSSYNLSVRRKGSSQISK